MGETPKPDYFKLATSLARAQWEVVNMPCEGCGHNTCFPRNYPWPRLCLECMEGLLPAEARPAFLEMLQAFGLIREGKPLT